MKYLLPLEMFYKWEKEKANEIYLSQPINGVEHTWTWNEFGIEVRKMATYLKSLKLNKNSKIGILSKNCAHWIMSDLAIMMSGHISVPLYPNLSSASLNKILNHSETKVLFVGKLDNYDDIKPGVPKDTHCITYPFYSQNYPVWDDLVKDIEPMQNILRKKDELATIIYTSGTTGMPKGVMHKFFNFSFSTTNALNTLSLNNESFFSYLPLSHIAERLLVEMGSLYTGGKVSFAESIDTFAMDLKNASPSVFLGVPRIWTKFQQGVFSKIPRKKLNILLSIPLVSFFIKKKIRTNLGLANAKNIFTGAAPTPVSLIKWFARIGVYIQEAYAMTENTCYSHVTLNDKIVVGSVGQALPHCQVKLSEKDEILIKHEALMNGYYKDESSTKNTIIDGWLHTGDKGSIDNNGFLTITGRVKDIFKTSKGKYVAPSPIEMKISANNNIEQVCVVGQNLPQPIALVTLSEKAKKRDKISLSNSLLKTFNIVNSKIEKHEKIETLVVLKDDWTVENKMITPTMKIKRDEVDKKYCSKYDDWYQSKKVKIV